MLRVIRSPNFGLASPGTDRARGSGTCVAVGTPTIPISSRTKRRISSGPCRRPSRRDTCVHSGTDRAKPYELDGDRRPSAGWAAKVFPQAPEPMQMSHCGGMQSPASVVWTHPIPRRLGGAPQGARCPQRIFEPQTIRRVEPSTGPGTDLTIGLPAGHVWVSGRIEQPGWNRALPQICRPRRSSRCPTRIVSTPTP